MSRVMKVAAIAGDGIGNEVMPEALRVIEAVARRYGLALEITSFPWANCEYYAQHGDMMSADWKEQLQGYDARFCSVP